VVAPRLADAEALLEDAAIVPLTSEDASELAGELLPEARGTAPFLVRGLCLQRTTGRFTVYLDGQSLVVHHGSLGSGSGLMERQPLVLQLDRAPIEVYVTCSMAR
jgi:hypothetical protein